MLDDDVDHVAPVSRAFGDLLEGVTTRKACGEVVPKIRNLCATLKAADPEIEILTMGPPLPFMYSTIHDRSSKAPGCLLLINVFILTLKLRSKDHVQSIICHRHLKSEPDFEIVRG